MQKKLIAMLCFFVVFIAHAQNENKYGLIPINDQNRHILEEAMLKMQPFKIMDTRNGGVELPTMVDNSKLKFFPPIVYQISNSCGPASMIHYQYTYEMNRLLDRDGKKDENILYYMYNWNLLNKGNEEGTHPWTCFEAINYYGAVPKSLFSTTSSTEWMDGIDNYKEAIKYDVADLTYIESNLPGKLEEMKRYLFDRGDGSAHGGLIQFSGWAHPLDATRYDGESESGYNAMIPRFGYDGMHSMMIIGYDDTTWWDYDKDGQKDEDEMGSFICVNTWGTSWGDKGIFFAPYRTFTDAMPQSDYKKDNGGGIGNGNKACYIYNPVQREPSLMFRLILKHDSRRSFKLKLSGYDENGAEIVKETLIKAFNQAGGDLPLRSHRGVDRDILEFGVDASILNKPGVVDYRIKIEGTRNIDENKDNKFLFCSLIDSRKDVNNPIETIGFISEPILTSYSISTASVKLSDSIYPEGESVLYSILNASDRVYIAIQAKEATSVNADLYDLNGTKLVNIINEEVPAGATFRTMRFDSKVKPGEYYVGIVLNQSVEMRKIIVK